MGRLLIQFAGTNTTKALSETLPKNTIIVDEDLHQLRLHDGTTQGGHIIGGSGGGGVPVGTIIPFAGNSIPEGYLLCDGSAISRTDYATLFSVIGTIYGAGNGNSTFNLPSLIYRTILGAGPDSGWEVGSSRLGAIPKITATTNSTGSHSHTRGTMNITGSTYGTAAGYLDYMVSWINSAGAFYGIETTSSHGMGGGGSHGTMMALGFDASRSWTGSTNSTGAHSHTVTVSSTGAMRDDGKVYPTSVSMRLYIKY